MEDFICPICNELYDTIIKIPRLFGNCGHTFCTECIENLIRKNPLEIKCPKDDLIYEYYNTKLGINSFPQNFALQNLIKKKDSFQEIDKDLKKKNSQKQIFEVEKNKNNLEEIKKENFCEEHEKKADVICITDKQIICTDCILFGNHKNHEYNKINDFKKKIRRSFAELESKNAKIDFIREKVINSKVIFRDEILKKKEVLKKEVIFIVNRVQEELDKKEKEILNEIEKLFLEFKEDENHIKKNSKKIIKNHEEIKDNIKKLRENYKKNNLDFKLFIKYLYDKENLFDNQKKIEKDIKNFEILNKKLVDSKLDKLEIKSDLEKIITFIKNGIYLKEEDNLNLSEDLDKNDLISKSEKFKEEDIDTPKNNQKLNIKKHIINKKKKKKKNFEEDVSLIDLKFDIDLDSDSEETLTKINHRKKKNQKRNIVSKRRSFIANDNKLTKSVHHIRKRTFDDRLIKKKIQRRPKLKSRPQTPKIKKNLLYAEIQEDEFLHLTPGFKKPKFFSRKDWASEKNDSFEQKILPEPITPIRPKTKHPLSRRAKISKNSDKLDFSNKKISDNILLKYIKKIAKNKNVKEINLSKNRITSKGFENFIKKLKNHPSLEKVILHQNFLDFSIFRVLTKFGNDLRKMKFFDCRFNKEFSGSSLPYQVYLQNLETIDIKVEI